LRETRRRTPEPASGSQTPIAAAADD